MRSQSYLKLISTFVHVIDILLPVHYFIRCSTKNQETRNNVDNVTEERDSQYDVMLSKMFG